MTLSFLCFISCIQSLNILSETIPEIHKHLFAPHKIQNIIGMVVSTVVRGPSLAGLALVLVLFFKPAVKRQPGFRQ